VNLGTPATAVIVTVTHLVLVALLGFWLALRQDERRWLREKRADLYIDLMAEGYAEHNWVEHELTTMEIREIADKNGTDHDAGRRGEDEWQDRFGGLTDTRLPPSERALLGARMSAFATVDVIRLFNSIGVCSPTLPRRGQAAELRIELNMAWAALENGVRAELHQSQRTTWQRLGQRLNRRRNTKTAMAQTFSAKEIGHTRTPRQRSQRHVPEREAHRRWAAGP
jgi:hypothetical protein